MPTLLSSPSCSDAPEDTSTPEPAEAQSFHPRPTSWRRFAGLVCLVLALGMASLAFTPTALLAFDVAQVARLAALATGTDLARHVVPSPADTASTDGASASGMPSACVPGNRDALGENLVIERDAWICGAVTVYAANVSVLGRVDGDVRAIGGSIVIAGQVSGGVTAVGGNVDLQAGARVGGDVQAIGGTVNRDVDSYISGNVATNEDALQRYGPQHALDPYTSEIPWVQLLFWGLAGAALSLLFPQYVLRVRVMVQRQLAASFVTGVMALLGGVAASIVLIVSCLGIPVALLLLASLWVAWVIGTVALGSWLGHSLLHLFARESQWMGLATVLGVMLLAALEALPYVGWAIFTVAGFLGLGAAVRSYFAARQSARALRRAA
jgi:hypothetical protein